jgi:hypothetical protein
VTFDDLPLQLLIRRDQIGRTLGNFLLKCIIGQLQCLLRREALRNKKASLAGIKKQEQ